MGKREGVLLSLEQAVEAVCRDFRQYDPQILLFCSSIRLITAGTTHIRRDRKGEGLWISSKGRRAMRRLDGYELAEYLCDTLTRTPPDLDLLSELCRRTFQTRAFPEVDPVTGREGIFVETGMEDFRCRQCGRCCRSLDYHDQVTAEDVEGWRKLGRTDILERVAVFEGRGRETAYRIWIEPGTLTISESCPFLEKVPRKDLWVCRIHDVKPAICRQYPASRKHAVMTGCPGFEKDRHERKGR